MTREGIPMADGRTGPGPERLGVLAALLEFDAERSDIADVWTHADGRPYADAEAALITSATMEEWALADALRGGPDQAPGKDTGTIADLLRLADGTDAATLLCLGLRETLLDGRPGDRDAAFAGVYRRLALPGLDAAGRDRASALLGHLAGRH
jgi:hypothetical protein